MGLRPTDGHESPPSLSFLAQIDMTLRLTLYMKMREALRSGVACSFAQASLLAVEGYAVPLESETASKLAGSKRQQAAALHSACGA